MGAGVAGTRAGLQVVGPRAEVWFCPSQGAQYVWNRTALIQASQDPSVTHLMGNDPTHPTSLPCTPGSSHGQACTDTWLPWTLPLSSLPVTQIPFPTGLFEPADMKYEAQRDLTLDPSLTEMTEAALRVLSRNPSGFYLFVEGERVAAPP